MASSSPDNAEIIAAIQSSLTETYILTATVALVAFEHIITLGQEISTIWGRKFTGVTMLFMLNRYALLTYVIISVAPTSKIECTVGLRIQEAAETIQLVVLAVFSGLRIYALWDRKVILFMLVTGINLVPIAINIFYYSISIPFYSFDPVFGSFCSTSGGGISPETNYRAVAVTIRAALIAGDVLVLLLTWARTFRVKREAMRVNMDLPISDLLLRDGTVYFVILMSMNVLQILVESVPALVVITDSNLFWNIITGILVSRFILNLRQIGHEPGDSTITDTAPMSAPRFNHAPSSGFTGNMGEQLEYGADVDEPSIDV